MYCANCGSKLRVGDRFCVRCGSQVQSGSAFCRECGARLKDGAAFCEQCGAMRNSAPAPNDARFAPIDANPYAVPPEKANPFDVPRIAPAPSGGGSTQFRIPVPEPPKTKDYLIWNILAILFCSFPLPLGLVGTYYSYRAVAAKARDDLDEFEKQAKIARTIFWTNVLVAMIVGPILWSFLFGTFLLFPLFS